MNRLFSFFEENFDTSLLETKNGIYTINQKIYDKVIYQNKWILQGHG